MSHGSDIARIITGRPAVDWYTLTWLENGYDGPPETIEELIDTSKNLTWKRDSLMQFAGKRWQNGMFLGYNKERLNPGRWGMLQCSGSAADRLLDCIGEDADRFNKTRIDVQFTFPLVDKTLVRAIYECMVHPDVEWLGKGPTPKVTLIQSGETGQTLYVGAPSSEKRVRLYLKQGADRLYWRLEYQARKEAAQRLYLQMCEYGRQGAADALMASISRWPEVMQNRMQLEGLSISQNNGILDTGGAETTDERRLDWCLLTAIPGMKKALQGPYKERVVRGLRAMIEEAENLRETDTTEHGS